MTVKISLFLVLTVLTVEVYSQTNVLTQHFDNMRTGWYNAETVLNTQNVRPGVFGKIFTRSVDDQMYAQPLVVNVDLPVGKRNMVIAATVNNSLYAYDADSANITQPYWQVNLTPSGSRPPQNTDMVGACGGNYRDFSGKMGIVGTPVIDPATLTLYVVARSMNSANEHAQYLHALDVVTGQERANSPILITATMTGSGDGNVGGVLTFNPQRQNQRPALLLSNNTIYIAWSSHCDWSPYHGWIIGYDATTLQQVRVYNTTPEGYNGGIWMCGSGPSVDESGNIYVGVGNGSAGKNGNQLDVTNRSESALKLTVSGSTLAVSSFFTPKNYTELEDGDLDFGTSQVLLIPNTDRALVGCKDGELFLLDRNNMGGFNSGSNNVLQDINLGTNATMHSNLSYYKGSLKEWVYTWSENSLLKAFNYDRNTNLFNLANTVSSPAQGPVGYSGAFLSVSSNGATNSTAVLWVSHAATGDANQSVRPGILRAFDANDVTKELWSTSFYPSDSPGSYAKFNAPVIANGKVYLGSFSGQLLVYGLLKNGNTPTCTYGNIGLNQQGVASSTSSGSVANAFDGNTATVWKSAATDPQWISVDLGQRYDLCTVNIEWGAQPGVNFSLQVADDNQNWTSMVNVTGNSSLNSEYPVTGSGRFVRMLGTSGTGGYIIEEFEVLGTPSAVQCPSPFVQPVTNIYGNSATLNWSSVGNNFVVQYKTVSASNWSQVVTTGTTLTLNALACATDFLYRVRNVCSVSDSSAFASGAFSTIACDPNCGKLLTRWSTLDIGNVQAAGSACYSNGTFTLHGSGDDIWNAQDAFRFAYKTFVGDGEIYVRIASMDNTDPWNKCGVMIRETLADGSRHALMAMTSGNGAAFQYRLMDSGESTNVNTGAGTAAPYWVKLTKQGSVFTGFASTDSVHWVRVALPVDLGFGNGTPVYAGFALTSHNNGVLSTAVLDNMFITGSFQYELKNVSASLSLDKTVAIQWTTTLEGSIQRFVIQRQNGTSFENLDTLSAVNQGKFTHTYNDIDLTPPTSGFAYYRIMMVSLDGIIRYSPTVAVLINGSRPPSVYPNPAGGTTSQNFFVAQGDLNEPLQTINIYDIYGRFMLSVGNSKALSIMEIPTSGIPNGVYVIEIATTKSKYATKLVIKN